jgi:hypothetical protein
VTKSIEFLHKIANELDEVKRDVGISRTVGASAAILGTVAVLAVPFTGGISLFISGIAVATAGSLTTAGASIADSIIENKLKQNAEWCIPIIQEVQGLAFALFMVMTMHSRVVSAIKDDKAGLFGHIKNLVIRPGKQVYNVGVAAYKIKELVRLAEIIRKSRSLS